MKRFLTLILCLAVSIIGYSQCSVDGTPGNAPGVFPEPDSIPCIERNVPYDFTMQLKNFDSLALFGALNVDVISTTIDSIVNFPCGISWESDSLNYAPGELGCIRVFGTTSDIVGQYPVGIYITIVVDIPQAGPTPISGELKDLAGQAGVNTDYNYVSRVIEQGDPCPARDQNAAMTSSGGTCPPLAVDIIGVLNFCGGSETLTAVPKYHVGNVSFAWNTTETSDAISVSTSGTYSVTVTDDNGAASTTVTVDANALPQAGFTSSVALNGVTVNFTNTSTIADAYTWDFGDGNTSSDTDPSHTYTTDSTYTVILTATNNCGSDSDTADVTVVTPPCVPNAATGNPGVFPHPDSIPCIERGLPYDYTMHTENFDTFALDANLLGLAIHVDAAVNWIRIDSIENFPCGISWVSNKLQYGPGETGCIKVSGTSREIPGQYPLKTYVTIQLYIDPNTPVIGGLIGGIQEVDGELSSLVDQFESLGGQGGYDFNYISRVIQPGGNCPARDTTSESEASGDVCPPMSAVITGTPTICDGQATTLTAVAQYETGTVTYLWSDNTTTTSTFTASAAGTYSVTVTDQSGTATASVTVGTGTSPAAGFTPVVTGVGIVTVNNTSTPSTGVTYLWNFGDPGSGSSNTSTLASPVHTYTSNGQKTITLTVTNSCGADIDTQTVNITGVFVASIEYDLAFDMFPNPSNGTVALQFSAESANDVYDLNIFDLSGKNVYREKITGVSGTAQKQLDLGSLSKGVYTLRLNSEKGFGVKKLILN